MSFDSWRISRRAFGSLLASTVIASSSTAIAQGSKIRRVGVLELGVPWPPELIWEQAEPLRKLGWIEGQNLHVERRYDNGQPEVLDVLAADLVRAQAEILVTAGSAATLAAKRATTSIPIVFRTAGDPVLLGLVASLARPGGNVTGYSNAGPELTAKSLSVLKELLPELQRIGVLWEANHPYYRATRAQFEQVCRSLRLEAIFVEYARPSDIGDAIAQVAARRRAQALLVSTDDFVWDHRFEIFDAATKRGLPTMADDDAMVREAGAMISYNPTGVESDRVRAQYIDRILRGARPADLPVQQPTKFVLVINLKTARAVGLTIPTKFLLRADEVIQ